MSPRTKEQFEHIRDGRREELLLAALKVFSRRGLAATKIGDIAEAAGMSHGLVYHYFPSKEEIFAELVRMAISGSAQAVRQLDALPLGPLEKIRAIGTAVLKTIGEDDSTAYFFFLMMQACLSDANPPEVRDMIRTATEPTDILLRIVKEGQATGCIREGDPEQLVDVFWATVQGLAVYKIGGGNNFSMPDGGLLVRLFEK
jgi:AcrR family transcriptional regulator